MNALPIIAGIYFVSRFVVEKKNICAKLNENTLIILMPTRRTQKECLS